MTPQETTMPDLAKTETLQTGTTALMSDAARRNHGLMIDAGSGGSRMHVFEWKSRFFDVIPPPISSPSSRNKWTGRFKPGLSTLVGKGKKYVWNHLCPLIEFAKEVLKDYEEDWPVFPLFLKATGGMRQLPLKERQEIMSHVRDLLFDKKLCPFHVEFEFIRIISGEEEAVYGWTAINFLKGNLLLSSQGAGTATSNLTVGALDMGGASTQISFFRKEEDILANLFKLQIGPSKHWNVYCHSMLYYGSSSARLRMQQRLLDDYLNPGWRRRRLTDTDQATVPGTNWTYSKVDKKSKKLPAVQDACMPYGYSVEFTSGENERYRIIGNDYQAEKSYKDCRSQVLPLLNKQLNSWCDFAHLGQCSMGGVYQPDLPSHDDAPFYAFGGYFKGWQTLDLPENVSISEVEKRTHIICSMTWVELNKYNEKVLNGDVKKDILWNSCFLNTYGLALLTEGYGFRSDNIIRFVDKLEGYKVGWALGSMLYEINALPWGYSGQCSSPNAHDNAVNSTRSQSLYSVNPSDQQDKDSGVSHHYIQLPSDTVACVALVFIVAVSLLVVKMYKRRNSTVVIRDSCARHIYGGDGSTGYMTMSTADRRVIQASP